MAQEKLERFENEDEYRKIANDMADLTETVISQYRDFFLHSNPACLELRMHISRVAQCKSFFKNFVSPEKDFRIKIIALLDLAQDVFKENSTEVKSFYREFEKAKAETEKSGARGYGASGSPKNG